MPARSPSLKLVGRLHHSTVFGRRVRVLSRDIAEFLPPGRMLDVGSGSGRIAAAIAGLRPDVSVEGFDVLIRPGQAIPTRAFDGRGLPEPADSASSAILVDVLHHASDPARLLAECARVAPVVVVKDHLQRNRLDGALLSVMDWVGNRPHGVVLPYAYLGPDEWSALCAQAGLVETARHSVPDLYPFPVSSVFGRDLHFVARLERRRPTAA